MASASDPVRARSANRLGLVMQDYKGLESTLCADAATTPSPARSSRPFSSTASNRTAW